MSDVNDVAYQYNKIAIRFDSSRIRIWNNVKKFLSKCDENNKLKLLDAGCGNGKNSLYALSLNYDVVGMDISTELLNISKQKGLNVYYEDILNLDISEEYDKCISIAVIHHLNSLELQCKAISNLINSLKNNGELLISVWSYEKENVLFKDNCDDINGIKNDYRDFVKGHNYIDWKTDNEIIKRYYYIHDYYSFKKLIEMVDNIHNISYIISWEKQNWFCKINKNIQYI
jgi:SAM-dependent methyltransferase